MNELSSMKYFTCPSCSGTLEIGGDEEKGMDLALCHDCGREFQITVSIGEEIT